MKQASSPPRWLPRGESGCLEEFRLEPKYYKVHAASHKFVVGLQSQSQDPYEGSLPSGSEAGTLRLPPPSPGKLE